MKRLITTCLVCALLTTTAWGMIITFDENGNGNVNDYGVITPLEFGMDTPPVGHATLYYVLPMFAPGTMGQGDLVVLEPESTSEISDILRFINITLSTQGDIQARVYVYSDLPEEGELPPYDLADTGIPAVWDNPPNHPYYMNEVGLEGGMNGVRYDTGGWPETYVFISDVPEPATICLLGLGTLSLIRKKHA